MSRIGKKPVSIPDGVEVKVNDQLVTAKGSKGELTVTVPDEVSVSQNGQVIEVAPIDNSQSARSFWGLSRSLIQNIFIGVSEGFLKKLELQGVGYRAQIQGAILKMGLGFSHDIDYKIPEGIKIECPSQTEILVSGIDKQKVGQVAAEIRSYRPPEPYKGKGVRYVGEYVFRKEGKKK